MDIVIQPLSIVSIAIIIFIIAGLIYAFLKNTQLLLLLL